MESHASYEHNGRKSPLFVVSSELDICRVGAFMGGPDPFVFSKDRKISHHEELHPHEHLSSRSITHFSMPIDLDR